MTEALRLLERLEKERFYGALELKFENGHVTVMKKTETILPTKSRQSGASHNVSLTPSKP